MEKIIVTSALPYAYSVPHLGNFVGSVLPADVFYKYLKMKGTNAIFICGSDQHGTPIELAAIKRGIEPQQLADEMHNTIKGLFEKMECTFSYYGKTHTEQNKDTVYELFNSLRDKGYITPTEDMQAYCDVDVTMIFSIRSTLCFPLFTRTYIIIICAWLRTSGCLPHHTSCLCPASMQLIACPR